MSHRQILSRVDKLLEDGRLYLTAKLPLQSLQVTPACRLVVGQLSRHHQSACNVRKHLKRIHIELAGIFADTDAEV